MLIPADRVTLRSWLAWYHMLAGGAGMIMTLSVAPTLLGQVPPETRPIVGVVFLAMVGLFAVVAWAGVLLSIRSPWGPPAATLVQILQLPFVRVGSYLWTFFGGGYLVPYWQVGRGLGIVVGVKANLQLSWGGAAEATIVGVNAIPLVILWLLRRKLPSSEAVQQTSDEMGEGVADSGAASQVDGPRLSSTEPLRGSAAVISDVAAIATVPGGPTLPPASP